MKTFRVFIHLLFRRLHIPSHYFLVVLAALIGYTTALGAWVFKTGIHTLQEFSVSLQQSQPAWLFPLIPAIGGLICGMIVYTFAREAKGHGIPEVIYAVLMKGGVIRLRIAAAKLMATIMTLGSLGSAGMEGPIVQIGSSLGSGLGQFLKIPANAIKILVGCGAAAGIAATFNAPIGGVLFSLEVILGTFAPNTFTPIIVASVISAVTFHRMGGNQPLLHIGVEYHETLLDVALFGLLGVLCGACSVLFIRTLSVVEKAFASIRIPDWLKPALGGLIFGCIVLQFGNMAGPGELIMHQLLHEPAVPVALLIVWLLLKILCTSITLGSGGSGGVFFPSLVMGAITGAALHGFLSPYLPVAELEIYVMVGMAAFVSGTTHGPIAAILVLCEMSHQYTIILPLMAGSISAVIAARSIYELSIYSIKLWEKGIHLKDGHDLDILRTYHVRDLMEKAFDRVRGDLPLFQVLTRLNQTKDGYLIVEDESTGRVGTITHYDLTPFILDAKKGLRCTASEAMVINDESVCEDDPILVAHDRFLMEEVKYLRVLDRQGRFSGLVFKKDIMRSYRKALHHKSVQHG